MSAPLPSLAPRPIGRAWRAMTSRVVASGVGPAAAAAVAIGVAAAAVYWAQDLTLSHYDAKAHLVVARRILDSRQPGWMQIGAVWLPLPHLLNLLPVQVDWLYRTGGSAVLMSIAAFVLAAGSLWWLVARATGSRSAAWAAFAVFAAQPDVLYLQATPMTEALLMGFCLFGVAQLWRWAEGGGRGRVWPIGTTFALACLTRYEAWSITVAALALAAVALRWRGLSTAAVAGRVGALAAFPLVAVGAFLCLSRATVGAWLVTGGFHEFDPSFHHRPLAGLTALARGVVLLNGHATVAFAVVGLVVLLRGLGRRPASVAVLVVLALAASAALPLFAFWNGHAFRIRYMVPLTMVLAAVIGLGVGLLPRGRRVAAAVVVLVALVETPPLSGRSPMVLEAQWDRTRTLERRNVTACLRTHYDGTPILASMGSLAHYMQETAPFGFALRVFIHEGLGQLWADSLHWPGRHAGWVLIAEQATVRDRLARVLKGDPDFLAGFERVCEGGGVTLYRRVAERSPRFGASE